MLRPLRHVDVPAMIREPCMIIVAETATDRYLKDNIAVTRQHNLVLSDYKYLYCYVLLSNTYILSFTNHYVNDERIGLPFFYIWYFLVDIFLEVWH